MFYEQDYIKYKIVATNNSDKEYELTKLNNNINYLEYKLESEDQSNIIKPN